MRISTIALVAMAGVAVASSASAQQFEPSTTQAQPAYGADQSALSPSLSTQTSLSSATGKPVLVPPDYEIGAQDVLSVEVFGVPELTHTVQVDDSGTIALPLIGRLQATGRTTDQLSQQIASELDTKYVRNPIVTVTVTNPTSQKITVDGSVTQPGVYPIGPATTLTEAVALAKGPDNVADVHHVSIIRKDAGARTVAVYDLDDIHDGKVVDPLVRANDEIVVDVSGTRKFVRDFSSVFPLLYILHP